jgi:hypothetical protein
MEGTITCAGGKMSPGENSGTGRNPNTKSRQTSGTENPPPTEPPNLQTLLEQLTYCIALAKRLVDASLAEVIKK